MVHILAISGRNFFRGWEFQCFICVCATCGFKLANTSGMRGQQARFFVFLWNTGKITYILRSRSLSTHLYKLFYFFKRTAHKINFCFLNSLLSKDVSFLLGYIQTVIWLEIKSWVQCHSNNILQIFVWVHITAWYRSFKKIKINLCVERNIAVRKNILYNKYVFICLTIPNIRPDCGK